MEELFVQLAGLAGVGALIAFIINALKTFGVVQDGTAQNWSAGLNLLAMAGLLALRVFAPDYPLAETDAQIAQFVNVAVVVFGYVVQLLGSKITHVAVRNVPVIGKSLTAKP